MSKHEDKLTVLSSIPHYAAIQTQLFAHCIKTTIANHPKAVTIAAGLTAGAVAGIALVDGDKAHPSSAYKKVFN